MTKQSFRYLLAFVLAAAALAASTPAHAQGIVNVRSFDATTSPPKVFVRADPVDDAGELMSGLPPEQWKLIYYKKVTDADAVKAKAKDKDPISTPALSIKPFIESDTTVALLIMVEGAKAFIGDKEYEQASDEVTPIAGTLNEVKDAAKTLADAVGPNGVAGVSFFGDNVMEKIPIGPPGRVKSDVDAIRQEEFKSIRTHGFFGAVDSGIATLMKSGKQRKILVLISSGLEGLQNDQKPDNYVEKAQRAGVEIYALHYTTDELGTSGTRNMKSLGNAGAFSTTKKPDQIISLSKSIKERILGEYILEFNAPEAPWSSDSDKKELRGVKVLAGGAQSEKREYAFGYYKKPSKGHVWPWIVFPLLGLLLIVAVVLIAKRKPEPEPVYEAPPMPAPVAAAPSPAKTVMLNVSGGGDDYPLVGWIVAVAGPQLGQTFKLQVGRTTIGTSQDQQIVVMDPFMSSRHAEIICTQMGFQLIDVGSSNGSYVNAKRIKSHDLVDNDAFTLGKTDFKFKSIN